MKYVSYLRAGRPAVGMVDGETVVPLTGVDDVSVGIEALRGAQADETAREQLSAITLLPSSATPRRVICVGLNYSDHIAETKRDLPEYPVLFPKFASSLIGAYDDIVLPPESHQVDWEGELAVVIGRAGRRIRREDAAEHVLGFSTANDITMRDYQYKTHQWMQGKAWDDSTPIGPWIITPDEVDLNGAAISTTVNGVEMQRSDLGKLIFDVPFLVSALSEFTTLQPGDVILTGTPGGVGYRRDPQVFLQIGDDVTVSIEGVGAVSNRVVASGDLS